ncbi:MAG: NAD(+) synthase [Candidatus Krumholzibacteria bacterium]|nr:NAD(+) synthase [Candidatus Krumholzibacteria bacterium]
MAFSKDVLRIDPEQVSRAIERFIRDSLSDFYHRKGIVIGLSGGIDSAVSASLSVRAIGADRVVGLLLPESDSNPVSRLYGAKMAEKLGIECHEIEITPYLQSLGVYDKRNAVVQKLFPELSPPFRFRLVLPQNLLDEDRISAYHIEVQLEDGSVESRRLPVKSYLELMAANDIKQRVRMIQMYYEAERRYYIVCGTTNLPEAMQGFFVKGGDGCVDIEPLAWLYKRQVYDLGRHLGVIDEILSRDPSPDTYSYVVSDKDFYFCMPYDILDYILYGVEKSVPKNEVAAALGLSVDQVGRAWNDIIRKREATRHLREMPPSPKFDF